MLDTLKNADRIRRILEFVRENNTAFWYSDEYWAMFNESHPWIRVSNKEVEVELNREIDAAFGITKRTKANEWRYSSPLCEAKVYDTYQATKHIIWLLVEEETLAEFLYLDGDSVRFLDSSIKVGRGVMQLRAMMIAEGAI